MFDIEVIVSIAILAAVALAIWKGGQANPESNRSVLNRVSKLTGRVEAIEQALVHVCKREDLAAIAGKIDALEEYSASAGDFNALEGKINALDAKVEGIGKAADRTEDAVQRIEGYLIQKGLGK